MKPVGTYKAILKKPRHAKGLNEPPKKAKPVVLTKADLARLLKGRQVVVEDSRHLIMLDRPDLVAEAVRALRREVGTTR